MPTCLLVCGCVDGGVGEMMNGSPVKGPEQPKPHAVPCRQHGAPSPIKGPKGRFVAPGPALPMATLREEEEEAAAAAAAATASSHQAVAVAGAAGAVDGHGAAGGVQGVPSSVAGLPPPHDAEAGQAVAAAGAGSGGAPPQQQRRQSSSSPSRSPPSSRGALHLDPHPVRTRQESSRVAAAMPAAAVTHTRPASGTPGEHDHTPAAMTNEHVEATAAMTNEHGSGFAGTTFEGDDDAAAVVTSGHSGDQGPGSKRSSSTGLLAGAEAG